MANAKEKINTVGRRKNAVARVYLSEGSGTVLVNKRPIAEYFTIEQLRILISQPFEATNTINKFDVHANITGGGTSGQAGALRHAIARALVKADAQYKPALKKAGLLTRDPRMKERKKYGQKGARKRFQFSKR